MSMPILSPLTFFCSGTGRAVDIIDVVQAMRTTNAFTLLTNGDPGCKSSPVFLSNSQSQIFSYHSVDLAEKPFNLPLLHLFLPEGNSAFAQHPGTWGLYDLSV